jgi:cytidylate kinase
MLAKQLKWHFLDSGAIYRVLAHAALLAKIQLDDEPALEKLALSLPLKFSEDLATGKMDIYLDNQQITDAIRTECCGNNASKIASLVKIRQALLQRQRDFRQLPGLVADGRDMGTIVFSDAKLKFFLDASNEARAKRRYLQLKQLGHDVNIHDLVEEINLRDLRDRDRVVSPLLPDNDAIIIDTTDLDIYAVYCKIMEYVQTSSIGVGLNY